jgi:hypothetical protein
VQFGDGGVAYSTIISSALTKEDERNKIRTNNNAENEMKNN